MPRIRFTRANSNNASLTPFLVVAVVLHLFFLQAVGFAPPDLSSNNTPTSLDVTLAMHYSEKAPEQADFIGQANQEGSGNSEKVNAPTTTEEAAFPDPSFKEVSSVPETPPAESASTPAITAEAISNKTVADSKDAPQPEPEAEPLPTSGLVARSLEIASLAAQLDAERKLYAKRPRKRFISSAAIRSADDAAYLDQWRRRIERVGNLNYPSEARSNKIFGEMVVAVTVLANGTIKQIEIERSSGQRLLDDAARKIVHLAAPFAPLPRELKADELTIIKTWRFEPGGLTARN